MDRYGVSVVGLSLPSGLYVTIAQETTWRDLGL
jgi:hypothetical protein